MTDQQGEPDVEPDRFYYVRPIADGLGEDDIVVAYAQHLALDDWARGVAAAGYEPDGEPLAEVESYGLVPGYSRAVRVIGRIRPTTASPAAASPSW